MASTDLYPISDVYNSGWTAASGSTLWNMINGQDQDDTTYIQVTNTGLPFKVQANPVFPPYGPGASTVSVNIVARTTTGSAFINGSAYDADGKYIGDITKNINTTTYSAYVVPLNQNLSNNFKGITIELQNSANPGVSSQLSTLRISDLSVTVSSAPFVERMTFQEAVNRTYGYGPHDYSPEEAIARYLQLDDKYYKGKYTLQQLYNILHFNKKDKSLYTSDPIRYYGNTRASLVDLQTNPAPLDGAAYSKETLAAKEIASSITFPDILTTHLPQVTRYGFSQNVMNLSANDGSVLYTNASLPSAYQDNGTSLYVGYSAGVFATGSIPAFMSSTTIGQYAMGLEIKPFAASSSYVGQNTLFEIPNFLRIDFSGSGFNQFVLQMSDGAAYVSGMQSNGVTFGAGETVRLEYLYVVPSLIANSYVNNVANAFVSDGAFNGGTLGATFYLGTDAAAANPFSGAISELRFTDDIKLYD